MGRTSAVLLASLTLLVMVIVAQSGATTCDTNEEYSTCGTACPVTCANRGTPVPCPAMCKTGCFCKKGTVRNANGKCVPVKDC
ncbi:chymotrypsin inhibitor-like isoform X2 [Phyllobates terribilis]|uniref:chymotrypsin inhibitor-like isoform X2 n=1 Tax=Phyllobates terribilis TaxID=111132 RepID=UPI003CCA8D07